jgi:hypothetical protein
MIFVTPSYPKQVALCEFITHIKELWAIIPQSQENTTPKDRI